MIRRNLLASTAIVLAAVATSAHAERGADGNLGILYWQAVSILNPYLSGGTKDVHASSMVIEPLAHFDETGKIVPSLASEVPTVENGGIAADLKSITWKLKPGVKWSDGTDFTAQDVVFTWKYCLAPGGGCQAMAKFADVTDVEPVDPLTVKISFSVPKPYPYVAFVGSQSPVIQAAQFKDCLGAKAPECTDANFKPIGTGPFRVTDFKANDSVAYEANPHYRDPTKPAFATAVIKGGGDAAAAGRAVLETGEYDYAWNLLLEPELLDQMQAGGKGTVVSAFGSLVERIELNAYAVDPSLGDKRSTKEAGPHPFLKDPAVWRALSMVIDRDLLVEIGYGISGRPACAIVPAPAAYVPEDVEWCKTADVAGANKLLDEAGWAKGGDGIREKDGVRLSVLYQSSTNSVRQAVQALVKDMWVQIGVEAELRNVAPAVFFGNDPSSPDTFPKFYSDVQMYANNYEGIDPEQYFAGWRCSDIPGPATGWKGKNIPRYCDADYDKLVDALATTVDAEKRAELSRLLNSKLSNDGALIPLIHRGDVSARSNTLEGVRMNAWDSQLWNVADWSRKK
ncbi:peptide ABC transporter substrate-binding protein [Mesorhizobium sp. LjNodule214]